MTKRLLGYAAAAEIDNALIDLAIISKAAAALARNHANREETLTKILEIVIHAQNAERALRNAKAPKPE